ncbi:hypothetical protein MMC24_002611 [Lignoscripta atroalba]|nr:hypothetical protein [Lignoscripta atroalba]
MSVSAVDTATGGTGGGPWILACEYCNWTSLDIDIQFERPNNIFGQLAKLRQKGLPQTPLSRSPEIEEPADTPSIQDPDARFAALKSFYSSQLSKSSSSNPLMTPSGDINYSSPSSLARIMSLYTGLGSYGKKPVDKSSMIRESADASEGLHVVNLASEEGAIQKLRELGWAGTTSVAQRAEQLHAPRFLDAVKPVPTLLRTKRSKRCRTCRHILVKPEAKVQSTRFRIKLVAVNYVLSVSVKPLLQMSPSTPGPVLDLQALPPTKACQFLLTLKNPMFDPVKVTLATPSLTSGRFRSKVTILCPQFDIGANTDVWDEALSGGDGKSRSSKTSKTKPEMGENEGKVAEAGKVWDKGRNWTTVVVEVVCAAIEAEDDDLEEDEDVLEIPVFVRVEYEADAAGDDGGASAEKDRREKRELAYWCILGVGKIARLSTL